MRLPWLERAGIAVASLALAVGLIALMSGYFAGRDQAALAGTAEIGLHFHDLGDAHMPPGAPRPIYDSNPPTSGPHIPLPVRADERPLSDDQLLEALELGDIVIAYGTRTPPTGLTALARQVAGPFSPALAAAGQAVILARRPGTVGLIGLSWTRMIRVSAPNDVVLRQFAQAWLGRGAAGASSVRPVP